MNKLLPAKGITLLLIISLTGCNNYKSMDESSVSSAEITQVSDRDQSMAENAGESNDDGGFAKLLRENQDFNRADAVEAVFSYDLTNPSLEELSEKYNLPQVAGDGNTQEKAINLLKWLSENVYHYGMYDNHIEQRSLSLLDYAFGKGEENGINCMGLSTILTDAMLSQGIYARTLWLMPGNPEDMDNHVVTMAYIPERNQWIFLDPTYNAYFSDDEGNVLSPKEIREGIVVSSSLTLNKDAHYNGEVIPENEAVGYLNYLAKNMFYFYCYGTQQYRSDTTQQERNTSNSLIYLCPKDFDVIEWNIANLRYRQNNTDHPMTSQELQQREDVLRSADIPYTTFDYFWKSPV